MNGLKLPPAEGIIFVHPDGPMFREYKNGKLTDFILKMTGPDIIHPELSVDTFYQRELGYNNIMLVADVIHPPEGGIKFKDIIRINLTQFGQWKTWQEYFEIAEKAIATFYSSDTTLVEFEQAPTFNTGSQP